MVTIAKFRGIECWAENGVVCLLDTTRAANVASLFDVPREEWSKIYKGIPPKEFIKRAIAAGCLELAKYFEYPQDQRKIRKFLEAAQAVYQEACAQGAIDDPKANVWFSKHPVKKLTLPTSYFADKARQLASRTAGQVLLEGIEENVPSSADKTSK